ncbi:MAG TPA: hypothetical protein VM554_01435 [Acidisarcina sp.]|nr:hypothetical protein [Acidisarcina sp.]
MDDHSEEMKKDQSMMFECGATKCPGKGFFCAAFTSMLASVALKIAGKDHMSLFIGQWAAPLLILATYKEMVKQHASNSPKMPETGDGGGI